MILNVLIFIAFLLFFLYLPAEVALRIFKIEKFGDTFLDFGLSLAFGMVFLTVISLIIRTLGLSFLWLWVLPIISLLSIIPDPFTSREVMASPPVGGSACHPRGVLRLLEYPHPLHPLSYFKRAYLYILAIIVLVMVTQNLVLFRGGWEVAGGRVFPSAHDTMWNIAIATELANHFPPQHPGMSEEPLKNHHYFYPFFLAVIHKLTNISILDIYFRLAPVLVSLLFALSLYAVSTIFTNKIIFRVMTIFLGIFSGNFAYFVPLFLGKNFDWKGNTFFSDQPFDQIINPYTVLGFSLFLFSIYALNKLFRSSKKLHLGWVIVASFLMGTLYGFKSFGGLIAIISLAISTMMVVILRQKINVLIVLLLTLLIFSPVFLLITDLGKATLNWAPGWLLTEMMGNHKLNLPIFIEIESYYLSINNLLGFIKIKMYEFIIYLLGNLGIRLVGMFYLLLMILGKVKFPNLSSLALLYIFFGTLVAFFLPLFFNLGQNAYNIIQFTPYALVLSAVLMVVALEEIYQNLIKKRRRVLGVVLIIMVTSLAIPVNIKNIISKLPMPNDFLPDEEINALIYIKNNSCKDDILLVNPTQLSLDGMYIPALSERRVYLASPGYARQTGKDPKEREEKIKNFFTKPTDSFLKENDISYIYLLKPYPHEDIEKKLSKINLRKVYGNEKVIIFSPFTSGEFPPVGGPPPR